MTEKKPKFIRGIDEALYKSARKKALDLGVAVGEVYNRAVAEFLRKGK